VLRPIARFLIPAAESITCRARTQAMDMADLYMTDLHMTDLHLTGLPIALVRGFVAGKF
jgi:hypothetical protein